MTMARRWMAYVVAHREREIAEVVAALGPYETLDFVGSASELRERLRDEEPRTVAVLVGPVPAGVSDINLAAAIVADGYAEEVALATDEASGSLRSRASHAGIARVIDLSSPIPRAVVAAEARENGPVAISSRQGASAAGPYGERPRRLGGAPMVAFASGRGGVGKTTLVAASAVIAAQWGMRVALCDLDLGTGNLSSAFGIARRSDLTLLAQAPTVTAQTVASCGVSCMEGVSIWGPCERPEMAEMAMPLVEDLLDVLVSSHDLVLCDASTMCTDAVAQAMQSADRLVLVHDMRPGSVSDLARTSALAVRLGVARTRIVRVENRVPARSWGQAFLPRAEVGLETARAFRVVDDGDEVAELMAAGRIKDLVGLEGDFARTMATFLARLLKELGSLPDCDGAHEAEEGARMRRTPFFGRRREVL